MFIKEKNLIYMQILSNVQLLNILIIYEKWKIKLDKKSLKIHIFVRFLQITVSLSKKAIKLIEIAKDVVDAVKINKPESLAIKIIIKKIYNYLKNTWKI